MTDLINLDNVLAAWAENVISKIQENLESTGTNASGRTSDSLEYELTDTGLRILGRQYFQSVEQGRPGGKVPYRFQDIIRQWMSDKGISEQFGEKEWQRRSAAYMIANFIKENGTSLYRSGGRDDIYTSVIDEELKKLEEQISIQVDEYVRTNINYAK